MHSLFTRLAASSLVDNEKSRVAAVDLPIPEDVSSCANIDVFLVRHYSFRWRVDMEKRQIRGTVNLRFERVDASRKKGDLVLDAHENIKISKISQGSTVKKFEQKKYCDFGDELIIREVIPCSGDLIIEYITSGQPAVNWLNPQQTFGGMKSMCYAMGQPCMNRALFPSQDCPRVRASWDINFILHGDEKVACAAPRISDTAFAMKEQTVPVYLMANFVIGRIEYREISHRSAVWAEPEIIDAAASEFSNCIELYLQAGEELFGTYPWGRYDIIIMPKSFAFGGMESPTLTFLSPTLVVGDNSLTDTIAHEIAHSWFGNLVTNQNWGQFYLNEGFTMYAQRCITNKVHGLSFTALEAKIGWALLKDAVRDLSSPATRLHISIGHNINPEDTYNDIPYEKGYAFVKYLESFVGQRNFHAWIRQYILDYAFSSVNSNQLIHSFLSSFPQHEHEFDWNLLLLGQGMPPYTPDFSSSLELSGPVDDLYQCATIQAVPCNAHSLFSSWTTYQQAYFLDKCIAEDNNSQFTKDPLALAEAIGLRTTHNCEISLRWSILLLKHSLVHIMNPDVANHLRKTGKIKFVIPVYLALARAQPRCIVDEFANSIFEETKHFLDSIVANRVETALATPISKPPLADDDNDESSKRKKMKKKSKQDEISIDTPGVGWAGLIRTPCVGCPKC